MEGGRSTTHRSRGPGRTATLPFGENVGIFDMNFCHPPTLRDVILEDKARTEVDPTEVHRMP